MLDIEKEVDKDMKEILTDISKINNMSIRINYFFAGIIVGMTIDLLVFIVT